MPSAEQSPENAVIRLLGEHKNIASAHFGCHKSSRKCVCACIVRLCSWREWRSLRGWPRLLFKLIFCYLLIFLSKLLCNYVRILGVIQSFAFILFDVILFTICISTRPYFKFISNLEFSCFYFLRSEPIPPSLFACKILIEF